MGCHLNGQENYPEKFKMAICSDNVSDQKVFASKLKSEYNSQVYDFYKLAFTNVEQNAILLTNSRKDTYPLKILQLTKQFRPDVEVVNLGFLSNDYYLKFLSKKYKLNLKKKEDKKKLIKQFVDSGLKVYLSTTVSSAYFDNSKYYLVGLSLELNTLKPHEKLIKFYSTLKSSGLLNYKWAVANQGLYQNFLPPLLTLYRYEKGKDRSGLKQDILSIAKKVNQLNKVNEILTRYN